MLPDQPANPPATPNPGQPWRWLLLDADGGEVAVEGDLADQRFASQADAESWLGEVFPDLAAAGVDQVTLLEADREVYGPMSLHA